MPLDPFRGFEAAAKLTERNKMPFSSVLDAFDAQQEGKMKFNRDVALTEAKARIYNPTSTQGSLNPDDLESVAQSLGVTPEDLLLNPTVSRYRGRASVTNVPQLKPPLGGKETNEIAAFRRTSQNLNKNLGMMTPEVEKYMNPLDPRAGRDGLGTFALKAQAMTGDKSAREFLTFKAETDKVFQQFRKETTGAQAALKELGWLEPDYPSPSDPPEVYRRKAEEAIRRIQDGERLLLDTYSQRGFRVGGLRQGGNPLQQYAQSQSQPTRSGGKIMVDSQGNRAMVYPDGSFEEL